MRFTHRGNWPRLRFSLRDLLWFLLVVGLAEAWWADHRRVNLEEARWRLIIERYESEMRGIVHREAALREREAAVNDPSLPMN